MALSRFAAVQWATFAVVAAALLYLLSPILTPFVAAGIIAYICNPPVRRLNAWGMPRTAAVILVMCALFLVVATLLLILLPLLEGEVTQLLARLPNWIEAARMRFLPLLQQWFGADLKWNSEAAKNLLLSHWQSAGGVLQKFWLVMASGGGAIFSLLVNLLLIPVAVFYLLCDWNKWWAEADRLIPPHSRTSARQIVLEVDRVLAEFLRGQLSVMLLMSLYYTLALWVVGLQFALPIGIMAGMLVFIPYLGVITGVVLATLSALMQFNEWGGLLLVWGVFGIGHLLEGMVVTPRFVGERIGLHPLAVIFALLSFGQIFGFFGVLLALPLSAILLVALRYARAWYFSSAMYNKS